MAKANTARTATRKAGSKKTASKTTRTRTTRASKQSASDARSAARRRQRRDARTTPRRWSKRVMETSDALDLEQHVFLREPRAIAQSLKRSAERSTRRKASPFRSAMSMLVFYINRAGKNLSRAQRAKLERAKDELRALYGKNK